MLTLDYSDHPSTGDALVEIVANKLNDLILSYNADFFFQRRTTSLELILTGRKIKDSGLELLLSDLQDGHTGRGPTNHKPCFRLKKLGLADNDLTWRSIPMLIEIVEMAGEELQDLDIDGNTGLLDDDGKEDWEVFQGVLRRMGLAPTQ